MNDENIYSLVEMLTSELTWDNLLVGVIPALITISGALLGVVRKFVKKFNLINENKYTLVDKIIEESSTEYVKKWLRWSYEALVIVFNEGFVAIIMWLFLLFADTRLNSSDTEKATLILMFATIIIFYIGILRNAGYGVVYGIIKNVMDTFCIVSFILMMVLFPVYEKRIIKSAIMLSYIVLAASMLVIFSRFGLYKNCKCRWIKISSIMRYTLLIGFGVYWISQLKTNMIIRNVVFIVWQIWCAIDGALIRITDDSNVVTVVLHMENREERSKNKIVQHKNNKIEYQSLDGRRMIIDDERIKKITYQMRSWCRKNSRAKYHVECVERGGESLYYQNYRIINGEWYVFSKA